jgi:hypothetical protein
MALAFDLGKEKMRFYMESGDAVISNTRNKLADHFLKSNAEWSLWIDDDIIPPIGRAAWWKNICRTNADYPERVAGQHVAHRLMEHGKSGKKVVGGLYFGRNSQGSPMFYEGLIDREAHMAARNMEDSVRKCGWVATGCLLVHRQVFLDIQAKFPELAPVLNPEPMQPKREFWDFFRLGVTDGEDVAFCKRAREAGHDVYVDTGLVCGHVGYQVYHSFNTSNGIQ